MKWLSKKPDVVIWMKAMTLCFEGVGDFLVIGKIKHLEVSMAEDKTNLILA